MNISGGGAYNLRGALNQKKQFSEGKKRFFYIRIWCKIVE